MLKSALRLGRSTRDLWTGIQRIERRDIHQRVEELRESAPHVDDDELHTRLIYAKCLEAGAIGAISGALELVPGVGKFAATVLGPLADASLVSTLQAELVAETFALYGVDLPHDAERVAVLAIAATNIGTATVGEGVGRAVVERAGKLVGGRISKLAGPIVNVVALAATNIAVTYAIGKRAQALAKMKNADFSAWPDLLRAVTMIDERKLARWATDSARTAMDRFSGLARKFGEGLIATLPSLPDLPTAAPKRAAVARRKAPTTRTPRVTARKAPARSDKSATPRKAARKTPARSTRRSSRA